MDILNQFDIQSEGFRIILLYILFAFIIIGFLIALIFTLNPVDTDFENPTNVNPSFSIIPEP